MGGYRRAELGFTIVETLIVLAVSTALVLSAIVLISGRSDKTQFMTATNDLKQQLQQIMNETATGYFPNANNFTCKNTGNALPTLTDGSAQQGTNGDCVFLGKAVQLGATGSTGNLQIYAIAGYRLSIAKKEVTSLDEASPEAIAPGVSHNASGLTGITQSYPLENGLTVGTMKYTGGNISGFALLTTLASYNAAGSSCNGVCSGSQNFTLYAIDKTGLTPGLDGPHFVDILDGQGAANSASNYIPTDNVTICFNSGTTANQSAVYTIGSSGNPQAVDMKIQSGACS